MCKTSKSVYHVSEQVFTICQVYTAPREPQRDSALNTFARPYLSPAAPRVTALQPTSPNTQSPNLKCEM